MDDRLKRLTDEYALLLGNWDGSDLSLEAVIRDVEGQLEEMGVDVEELNRWLLGRGR